MIVLPGIEQHQRAFQTFLAPRLYTSNDQLGKLPGEVLACVHRNIIVPQLLAIPPVSIGREVVENPGRSNKVRIAVQEHGEG